MFLFPAKPVRRLTLGVLTVSMLASFAGAGESVAQAAPEDEGVLVRFAPDADSGERAAARREAGASFEETLPLPGLQVVDPKPGRSADEVVALLERSDDVLYAEPDAVRTAFTFPNDEYASRLWGLRNTGQTFGTMTGTPDADIDASEAWDVTTGDATVTVGILDTGVDYTHPDLSPNIWVNQGESGEDPVSGEDRETNGLDDDGNGFVDDWRGWDWVNNDNAPADEHWHGTHVAGTVGARGNNSTGVAGVAWQVGLVPLRVLDAEGRGKVSDLVLAYAYANQMGLRIVNASLGGSGISQAEYEAIQAASNTLFVVAAGNNGTNNDVTGTYPCNHDLPNIICVAATDNKDALASFSNYGSTSVDLAAPGVNIYSSVPGPWWVYAGGTSMATPHVSGAAALQWALFPSATVADIRYALLESVDAKPSLAGKTTTGGRLNTYRALGFTPPAPPPAGSSAPVAAPPPATGGSTTVDTSPPTIVVVPRGRLKLRLGVKVRTRCSEACSLRHELVLGARTARRLGIRGSSTRVVGRARGSVGRAGTVTVRLKLRASARRRLRHARSLTLELRTRAVDRAGNARTVRRSIRLFTR